MEIFQNYLKRKHKTWLPDTATEYKAAETGVGESQPGDALLTAAFCNVLEELVRLTGPELKNNKENSTLVLFFFAQLGFFSLNFNCPVWSLMIVPTTTDQIKIKSNQIYLNA